jgi:hypothetical protein
VRRGFERVTLAPDDVARSVHPDASEGRAAMVAGRLVRSALCAHAGISAATFRDSRRHRRRRAGSRGVVLAPLREAAAVVLTHDPGR